MYYTLCKFNLEKDVCSQFKKRRKKSKTKRKNVMGKPSRRPDFSITLLFSHYKNEKNKLDWIISENETPFDSSGSLPSLETTN